MQGPVAAYLDGGQRLHLQHGPIDLIVGVDTPSPGDRQIGFDAAVARFDGLLEALVAELPRLRRPLSDDLAPSFSGPVARRMTRAALPFVAEQVTPMISVAGAVADEVLGAIRTAAQPRRAYVNNGGDIALHLAGEGAFSVAMANPAGATLGQLHIDGTSGIGGIATSGQSGRSLSLGIAESVTVLAGCAAEADAAATLIANAVDLPDLPGITRAPACDIQPDSDLGARRVVTGVPPLSDRDIAAALARGQARASDMCHRGLIQGAALFLQGQSVMTGATLVQDHTGSEKHYV
ncbi:MAG: UPF0280 family protein [Pseudomonadota bacterium]